MWKSLARELEFIRLENAPLGNLRIKIENSDVRWLPASNWISGSLKPSINEKLEKFRKKIRREVCAGTRLVGKMAGF